MITLTVNGKPRQIEAPLSLPEYLESLKVDQRYIAVAHNGRVLLRPEYKGVVLQEGDVLEIVRMVGGGKDV